MLNRLFVLMGIFYSSTALAGYFDDYVPTLDRLYDLGLSPINSSYSLTSEENDIKILPNEIRNGTKLTKIMLSEYNLSSIIGYFNDSDTPAIEQSGDRSGNIYNGIIADFIGNHLESNLTYIGGSAIFNKSLAHSMYDKDLRVWGGIKGDFINNSVVISKYNSQYGYGSVAGGAIYNAGEIIGGITGNFINNYVETTVNTLYSTASGGAISSSGKINGTINGDFVGNHALSDNGAAYGGALYISDATVSGNFINNYAVSNSSTGKYALGGAIFFSGQSLNISSNANDYIFSGNYTSYNSISGDRIWREIENNAIYIATSGGEVNLNISTYNKGTITFDDNIMFGYNLGGTDGGYGWGNCNGNCNININGDSTGTVVFKNRITGIDNLSITGSYLKMDKGPYGQAYFSTHAPINLIMRENASFDIANNYIEHINLTSLLGGGYIYIDLSPEKHNSDTITVQDNISGNFNIIVNSLSTLDIRDKEAILFASGKGGNKDSFNVYRVYGSPFMFDVVYKNSGITKNWYLSMNSTKNPDYDNTSEPENPNPEQPDIPGTTPENPDKPNPDTPNKPQKPAEIIITKPKVYPEITAFAALPNALLEQTRMTANNIVFTNKSGLWLQPILIYADNNNNVDTKSSTKGAEFGVSKNVNNDWSMGVFGSVLSGNHELNGNGQSFYSETASTIDTTSILLGGYIKRSPKRNFNLFLSVYGGKLDSEINTDDGITIDNSATQLSAKAIFGYDFNIANKFVVGPQIGTGFTHLTIEDSKDDFGKIATFDALNHLYADAGLKIELRLNNIDLYLKPAYMLTYNKGNEFQTNGIGSIQTIEDINIIKIDGGIDLKLTNNSYANIAVNYLIGDNYSSLGCTAGFGYKF